MNKRIKIGIGAAVLIILALLIQNCGGEKENDPEQPPVKKDVQITSPSNQDQYIAGDPIMVKIEVNHPELIDNLKLYVDDSLFADSLELISQEILVETNNSRVGYIPIYLEYLDGAGAVHRDNRTITIFSDKIPDKREVKVVKEYPHNPKSYTQGLEFYKGKLYEGTGQKGLSVLAEVDLNTGQTIREIALDASIFGEGITIMNDTIYQLSYVSGKCFIYDYNTFESIGEFTYQGEGWGICNDGKNLIMSNGSSQIVWRNPANFEVVKKIDVFDNQSNVAQLNELELINGDLYANIYTDTRICKIDTATGKVMAYYNCALMANAQPDGVDVLNGIATNEGKVYLTGKWWPKLYEVTFQ